MKDALIRQLSESLLQMSDTERHLLDYIVANIERIPRLSIVTLSEEAAVSTATIVRLMKKIGYEGYTEFKHHVRENLKERQSVTITADIDTQIKEAVHKNEQEVVRTIQMIDIRTVEEAIRQLRKAEKIYVFARGFSEMIATEMTVKLQLLGKNCEIHNDPNIIKVKARKLAEGDLVVFISLSGETEELVEAAGALKVKGITTLSLTTKTTSRLARLSDICLFGYKGEQSFFPNYEVRSRLPLHVLSRILLDAYVIRMSDESTPS
ncbi:MurR/RpiR family transcriptional regulator [Desmospora activa]|uniref:RpiR family transcriptional regulator n=1 Tax=Desmospora activa DSM 45169 TaxID=1121389 RepID=A0A2T4ZCA9_9BACL|nr:MurR/RpiR family transcriptional regulator [Desmospora activa]PTM59524.1 RpiR family transcriptional regulator [Desmospora activa DSM 45169]